MVIICSVLTDGVSSLTSNAAAPMLTHDQSLRVARLRYDLNHRIMPFVRPSQTFVQVTQEFRAELAALEAKANELRPRFPPQLAQGRAG